MLCLVDSGRGNLRSVEKALAAAGVSPIRSGDPDVVRKADRIVVPGQGAFADAMEALVANGLDEAILEHIAKGTPYLGICLGLQLLFQESDEHGPIAGLGVLAGRVEKLLAPGLKVPHMGWNNVTATRPDDVLTANPDGQPGEHYYFVHSYAAVPDNPEISVLLADYGGPVCAAIRKDNLTACQFHPEKSQQSGISLLRRWLKSS